MKKMSKKQLISLIIFNLFEVVCIIIIGLLMKIPLYLSITLLLVFFICRNNYGKAKHYKSGFKCFIWSELSFISIFLICQINTSLALLYTAFYALILSGKVDISDTFMWKGTNSKYSKIIDYIKKNPNLEIIKKFEEKLKRCDDEKLYKIYDFRFKQNMTFTQISDLVDIETNRLSDELSRIELAFKIYCDLN